MTKFYSVITVKTKEGKTFDWPYSIQAIKTNGGLDKHIKAVKHIFNVEVIGVHQYTAKKAVSL